MIKRLPITRKLLLFLLLAAFFTVPEAVASHLLGGNITYTFLRKNDTTGNYVYRVTLKAYVDATPPSRYDSGNLAQNPIFLSVYKNEKVATTAQRLLTYVPIPYRPATSSITPVVIPVANGCTVDSSDLLIKFYYNTFTADIELPFSLYGYNVIFSNRARSAQIDNLSLPDRNSQQGPNEGTSYIAFIPSPLTPNSSPQFVDEASTYVCLSDTVTLANTASDPDGDRLVYAFVQPLDANANANAQGAPPQTYTRPSTIRFDSTQGYSLAQPFGPGGIAEINAVTGFTRYHATRPGAYVVAFEIREYRTLSSGRDTLLSTTRREVQILVRDCLPNNPPVSNNGSPGGISNSTYTITEGERITFTVGAADSDSLTLSGSAAILDSTFNGPRATFPTVAGRGQVSSTFTWQTECGIRGTFPVTIRAVDKGCPPKTTNAVYLINVLPFQAPRQLSLGKDSVCGTADTYTYTLATSAPGNQLRWVVSGGLIVGTDTGRFIQVRFTPTSTQQEGYVRVIQTSGVGCKDSTTFPIQIFPTLPVVISPSSANLCQGDTVRLTARGGYGNFFWTDISGSAPRGLSGATDSTVRIYADSSHTYVVTSINAIGCRVKDTASVRFVPDVARAGRDTAFCSGQSTRLGVDSIPGYFYSWAPVRGLSLPAEAVTQVTLTNLALTDTTITYVQTATERLSGCVSQDSVRIRVFSAVLVNAVSSSPSVCSRDTVQLISQPFRPTQTYFWTAADSLTDIVRANRRDTASFTPGYFANNYGRTRRHTFYLFSRNPSSGCTARDTVQVVVNPLPIFRPVSAFNPVPAVCAGQFPVPLHTQYNNDTAYGAQDLFNDSIRFSFSRSGPLQYLSNPTSAGNPNFSYPFFASNDTTLILAYPVTVTYLATGCADTTTERIHVFPAPITRAGSDTTVCSGQPFRLGAAHGFGTRTYYWGRLYSDGHVADPTGFSSNTVPDPTATVFNPSQQDSTYTYVLLETRIYTLPPPHTDLNAPAIILCNNRDTVSATVHPLPIAQAGPDTVAVCSGSSIQLGADSATGYSYQWSPATGLSSAAVANPILTLTGTATQRLRYTLLVTNRITGCQKSDTIYVRLNPLPVLNLGTTTQVCAGSPASLGAFAADSALYVYSWSAPSGTIVAAGPRATYTNAVAGTYTIRLRVQNRATGCSKVDSLSLTVNPLPVLDQPLRDTAYCAGGQITLTDPYGAAYGQLWEAPAPAVLGSPNAVTTTFTLPNTTDAPIVTRVYLTLSQPVTGCKAKDSLDVTTNPTPRLTVLAPFPNVVCPGTPNQPYKVDTARTGYTYAWTVAPTGTLASGQGTDSITVNWNGPAQNVPITVVATNAYGCSQPTPTVVTVTVNELLHPATPNPLSGLTTLCFAQATDSYSTVTSPNSTYTWRYNLTGQPGTTVAGAGNTVQVTWPATGLAKIWVDEIAAPPPPFGQCFGSSDTLLVRINVSPTASVIDGPLTLCQFQEGAFHLAGLDSSLYAWKVQRTDSPYALDLTIVGDSTIRPRFDTAGTYLVRVLETSNRNCPGQAVAVSLTVNPKPVVIFRDTAFVCPQQTEVRFSLGVSLPQSVNWTVQAPATIVSGQGSNDIVIAPNGQPLAGVQAQITSEQGCQSDVVPVPFRSDNTAVELLSASTREEDDTKVLLRLRVTGNALQTDPARIERADNGGNFTVLSTESPVTDGQIVEVEDASPLATSANVNRYRVSLTNRCDLPVQSSVHATMLLTATAAQATSTASLTWTPYEGFTALGQYDVLRKADAEGSFSALSGSPSVGPTVTHLEPVVGQDGFKQAFRIKAIDSRTGEVSYSNIAQLSFENALLFYNVVAPNGNPDNRTLTFENLKLYPSNSLRVYNRWGREVFQADNYQGGYAPDEAGVYTYLFTTPGGVSHKGWFEVFK